MPGGRTRSHVLAAAGVVTVFAKPRAIGYLRADVSGSCKTWDEEQIRSTAKAHSHNLTKTVVFGSHTDDPLTRLLTVIERVEASVVIVPSAAHFDENKIPARLLAAVEVVTISPENTFAREMPQESRSHI